LDEPRDWRDQDPGLPITFGPASNGEYDPEPSLPPVLIETIRRAREACDANAQRLGLSRREFLLSICGAATTLLALDACSREAHRADPARITSEPGGGYDIPSEATIEPEPAHDAIGGEEFVFDIQGHLLEYDLNPVFNGLDFWQSFPQQHCGEDDPRVCYSIDHFLELMFLRSDTSMLVLSALPIYPQGSPLSPRIMDETRRIAEGLCRDDRVLLHAQALPNIGRPEDALDAMEATARRYPVVAWKTFTHFPTVFEGDGNAWWLDDHDPSLPQVGERFIRKAIELGLPTICTHKGFSGGTPFASPRDIGPAARRHPDVSFVVYHSGFEARTTEGPFTRATANVGVNRLIASMRRAGIGPNENVYAELGSTWWYVMRYPDQAAHVLGKLLRFVGEDNVVWGTDCLFYGSPQDQIQAMRSFHISEEFQERYGYPALTQRIKHKILGQNGARLYGIEPMAGRCEFSRRELETLRRAMPGRTTALGPSTRAEAERFRQHHREEIGTSG
jgi:predicted TIM-barrel fold metal-dependent hydrolase